jgi:hypothetical protein
VARVYATVSQLVAYSRRPACDDAEGMLESASELLDSEVFRLCWYDADTVTGLPTDAVVAEAFARAVCAQVRWWEETGDEDDVAGLFDTVKIGSVALSRGGSSRGGSSTPPSPVAPRALRALRSPDLTPDRFILGLVVS